MTTLKSKIRVLGVVALAAPLAVGVATPAHAAVTAPGAFAEAYGLLVDTTILSGAQPVKSGPHAATASSCLPGGTKSAQVLGAGDPAAARADVLNTTSTTDCSPVKATATAQTANVDALGVAAPVKIHADAVTSTSTTSCTTAPKGSTRIVGLSIGGTPVPVPELVAPNTVVADPALSVLGIKVILNEQHPASLGRGLVVNGIHIIAAAGTIPVGGAVIRGDIVISHAVSGVVCPGGPGQDNGGLPKPDISFFKAATPTVAKAGQTVTFTASVTNQSTTPCEVLKFVDHIAPAFSLVSTSGPFGTKFDTPAPGRLDGGVDAVIRPVGVTLGAGKTITQTFTVTVKDDATPGTYYNSLEIYCGRNGNFISGPMAPVTVAGPGQSPPPPTNPVIQPPGLPGGFAPTGLPVALTTGALLTLAAAVGVRRLSIARS